MKIFQNSSMKYIHLIFLYCCLKDVKHVFYDKIQNIDATFYCAINKNYEKLLFTDIIFHNKMEKLFLKKRAKKQETSK